MQALLVSVAIFDCAEQQDDVDARDSWRLCLISRVGGYPASIVVPPVCSTGEQLRASIRRNAGGLGANVLKQQSFTAAKMCLTALLCRMLQEVMRGPVVLMGGGCNYERAAIECYLAAGNRVSPSTGKTRESLGFVNHALRSLLGA